MKKLLLLAAIVFICSCAEKKNSDSAIKRLKDLYDIGNPETLGDGKIFYDFTPQLVRNHSMVRLNPGIASAKIKGCFDQGLGELPKRQKLGKYSSWNKSIMDIYEWETLTDMVTVEQHLKECTDTTGIFKCETNMYLQCKIWITKK